MDWYYEGERNPENWKNICEAFKKAENDSLQSPIQLCEKNAEKIHYHKTMNTRYHLTNFETSFFNHTVHLTPLSGQEVNFHLPSEHQINHESFPLEMHLVHRSKDNDLLVLAITVIPNKEPANLEKSRLDSLALNPRISGRGLLVPVDVAKLLPIKKQFFHYTGSLTTPPTIGPVNWIVFKNQTYMRKGLLQAFKENVGKTNRPLQPLGNRTIYLSE